MFRKIAGALAVVLLFSEARPLYAQNRPEVTQEVMVSSNPKERVVSRTVGNYEGRRYELFGMFDTTIPGNDYFLLLSGHRKLGRGVDLVSEIIKPRGSPADFGLGLGYDFPMPENSYFNAHALPLNLESGRVARSGELEMFGGAKFGRGYYVDGRAQFAFPYGEKRECRSELVVGKKLNGKFAAEASLAHNGRGTGVRADLKYGVYGK